MNNIRELIECVSKLFQWWIIILPWQKGMRIRLGNKVKLVSAGVHFKIPFFDQYYVQTTRLRVVQMAPQTISTKDKQTLTVVICAGYSISNIETLYNKMCQAESTISNIVMGEVSDYIYSSNMNECNPKAIEEKVMSKLQSEDYGIKFEYVKVIGYAIVKTYRLIQDAHWTSNSLLT